jgi:hypothetical protein
MRQYGRRNRRRLQASNATSETDFISRRNTIFIQLQICDSKTREGSHGVAFWWCQCDLLELPKIGFGGRKLRCIQHIAAVISSTECVFIIFINPTNFTAFAVHLTIGHEDESSCFFHASTPITLFAFESAVHCYLLTVKRCSCTLHLVRDQIN